MFELWELLALVSLFFGTIVSVDGEGDGDGDDGDGGDGDGGDGEGEGGSGAGGEGDGDAGSAGHLHDLAGDKGGKDAAGDPRRGDGSGDDDEPGDKGNRGELIFKERPEWLAKNFYDEKTGKVDVEALAESQQGLRAKLAKGLDKAPKNAEGYEVELPAELATIEKAMLVPDGDEPDPLQSWFKQAAFDAGLSQEQYGTLYQGYLQIGQAILPTPIDAQAEIKALGKNGMALLNHTVKFGENMIKNGVWNENDVTEFRIWTGTAHGILAFQKLQEFFGGKTIPDMAGEQAVSSTTASDLRKRQVDLDTRAGNGENVESELRALEHDYEKHYGTEPAGSSHVPAN